VSLVAPSSSRQEVNNFFVNTLPELKRYSDGEIHEAFLQELKTGRELQKATEKKRAAKAAKDGVDQRGVKNPVMGGKCVASMPMREFLQLVKKYGHAEVHSRKFIKYFNQRFPELTPNKI
jgi:hypothetical protein